MRKVAFYGKGGSGKTTVATGLSSLLARDGQRVLLLGCDPKHDTSYALVDRDKRRTLIELMHDGQAASLKPEAFLMHSDCGVDCVEAGGPEPGVGCAGRGITLMFDVIQKHGLLSDKYDWTIFDVLGDVVCGGFAAPIRAGFAQEVCVVVSGEILSMYAANNLCKALVRYQSTGVRLAGIVPNLRGTAGEEKMLREFAALLGTRTLPAIPRDPAVHQAHVAGKTVVDIAPQSKAAKALAAILDALRQSGPQDAAIPTPLSDEKFEEFVRIGWAPLAAVSGVENFSK